MADGGRERVGRRGPRPWGSGAQWLGPLAVAVCLLAGLVAAFGMAGLAGSGAGRTAAPPPETLATLSGRDVNELTKTRCVAVVSAAEGEWLQALSTSLGGSSRVLLGVNASHAAPALVVYRHRPLDRTCISTLGMRPLVPGAVFGRSSMGLGTLSPLEFVNQECFALRDATGALTAAGQLRERLEADLQPVSAPHSCVRVAGLSPADFVRDYLFQSRPVVVEGAARDWPAMSKWTNEHLLRTFPKRRFHIKLAPKGEFEGCDDLNQWEGWQWPPAHILEHLPFPDKVVVRPAHREMLLSEFFAYFRAPGSPSNVTAYLEYTSIRGQLRELLPDVERPAFGEQLIVEALNMWLSDGNTVGKLHFDPYDNFLCQLSGSKNVTLFDPFDNARLYESHLQQAELSFDPSTGAFAKRILHDSTSMVLCGSDYASVMSPVDIERPELGRFPRFAEAKPVTCQIDEGDVLFLPAWWWHEVRSSPHPHAHRNLAVNWWFKPFFTKEYPCPSCAHRVNAAYAQLLQDTAAAASPSHDGA